MKDQHLYILRIIAILSVLVVLPSCEKPEEKAARYIQQGNKYAKSEQYSKARLEYKNAARLKPTSAEVRYHLGLVDEAEGDIYNAFANFMAAEQQDAQHKKTVLKLAQYFMASNQLDPALERIEKVLTIDPTNTQAFAIKAAILLRQKNETDAEKLALKALDQDKTNVTATAVLVGLYQKQGHDSKAGEILEKGIQNTPNDDSLLLLKTTFYTRKNNLIKVKEAYKELFKRKPHKEEYRVAYINHLTSFNANDDLEITLRENIELFPHNKTMKHMLVSYLNKQKDMKTAETEIQKYIKQDPDEDSYYFWLTDLYLAHKNLDKAVELLRSIVNEERTKEGSLNAKTSLARINIVKGDRGLATRLIDAVLEKEPSHPDALYIRANIAFEDGAYQQAATDLRTIVRDNKKAISAYQLLSETFLTQGRIDLAIDTLGELIEHNPNAGMSIRVRLAQLFDANDNPEQGLALLETVTRTKPDYPFGWESTARLAISAKKFDLASDAIQKISNIKGYEHTASFLKGQLLVQQGSLDDGVKQLQTLIQNAYDQPISEHAISLLSTFQKPKDFITFLETLETKTPATYFELGKAYASIKDNNRAVIALDKALEAKPRIAAPYILRAEFAMHNKQPEAAYNYLLQASEAEPSDYLAPIMAAEILVKQHKYYEAIKLYEDVLSRNSEVHAAANNMADLIANKFSDDAKMLEKARLVAERFISSSNPLLLDTLAWVYHKQGKHQQALTVIERAIALSNNLPAIMHYRYGLILHETSQNNKARDQLEKALAKKEDFTGKEEARKLLKSIQS